MKCNYFLFLYIIIITSHLSSMHLLVDQDCSDTPLYNFNFDPVSGFTILTSGRYYLAENIIFNPSTTNVKMLKIRADNVHIDLNGKTVTQGNNNVNCTAIATSSGTRNNIIISNGAIHKFTSKALDIPKNTDIANLVVESLVIEDIGIAKNNRRADLISIQSISDAINIRFKNITISTNRIGKAFNLKGCSNVFIENCTILKQTMIHAKDRLDILAKNNFTTNNNIINYHTIDSCDNCIQFFDTNSKGAPITNVLIDHCNISGAMASNSMHLREVVNVVIKNCTIIDKNEYGICYDLDRVTQPKNIVMNNNIFYNTLSGTFPKKETINNEAQLLSILRG